MHWSTTRLRTLKIGRHLEFIFADDLSTLPARNTQIFAATYSVVTSNRSKARKYKLELELAIKKLHHKRRDVPRIFSGKNNFLLNWCSEIFHFSANAGSRTVCRSRKSKDFSEGSEGNFLEGNFKVSFTFTVEWIGRAAARCTAPKLPRAIRVGPHEGSKNFREFIQVHTALLSRSLSTYNTGSLSTDNTGSLSNYRYRSLST